jgi:hypothetical protein
MYFIRKQENVLENGVAKQKNKLKLIDAPVYGYWKALYMSFYSRRLYVDVGKRWRGFGLLYLLLVITVFSIPLSLKMGANLTQSFNKQIIDPLLQIPTVYVQNGEVSFDKPMPYFIKNKKSEVVSIIDTTGTIDGFSEKYPYLTILINKNIIYFKLPKPQLVPELIDQPNTGTPLSQPFGKGANFVFDGKKIVAENSMNKFKYMAQIMTYPVLIAMFYSMFVVLFLVLAFLGQVFSRIFFSFKITFMQSSRMFLVATTPMLLVLMLMLTINKLFPGFGFILMAILTTYFCLAIYSLRAESRQMVST